MNELALAAVVIVAILVMAAIGSSLSGESASVASVNARFAVMDRQADRNGTTCEICNGTAVYLCPICREVIETHSHENDYICKTHSFVSPVRQKDGARISGDGGCHPVVATVPEEVA